MKTREVLRLVWSTLTAWRHREPIEHPGSDRQWLLWQPDVPDLARLNESTQADKDDRRSDR